MGTPSPFLSLLSPPLSPLPSSLACPALLPIPPLTLTGKQVHVASTSVKTGLSTLHLAVLQNSAKHVRYILETAVAQWTPVPVPDAVETGKTKSVNNYDLVALMDTVKVRHFF
jgi:hypothetical protein